METLISDLPDYLIDTARRRPGRREDDGDRLWYAPAPPARAQRRRAPDGDLLRGCNPAVGGTVSDALTRTLG